MSATSDTAPKKSFLQSVWLRGFAIFIGLLLVLAAMLYANSSRVIVMLDDHFYEETLATCVLVFGWVAPDRQKVVLQTFCNVSMFTLAAQSLSAIDETEEQAL
ncbi:MAG: hypothetical protein ACI8RT_000880 [Candidatus Azotimanducaceae bacterium]|jgi:hypothetical protein|tara:strand:- start:1133 stop:1441 length:309 start_codon:yes stop_codon:yes gene_type:complete